MSEWTHNICADCWNKQHPDKNPVAPAAHDIDICCWCGTRNRDGIYQRAAPDKTPCEGVHDDHEPADS